MLLWWERDHFADELEERVNLDPNPDAFVRHAAAGGQSPATSPKMADRESDETVKEIVGDTFDAAARAVDDVVRFSKAAEAAYRVCHIQAYSPEQEGCYQHHQAAILQCLSSHQEHE